MLEITLALGRPELMPQAPVAVAGFKRESDATLWLVVKLTQTLSDSGLRRGWSWRRPLRRMARGQK